MDPGILQQFRQQLATWISQQMVSQRLPFQRLETCPRILTAQGRLTPDIVLWVNRDSQLAGSMILLPASVTAEVLNEATAMARALGLGHFTTWAARHVTIWAVTSTQPSTLQTFTLPAASRIQPEDFEETLTRLLEHLKIVSVTSAPATSELPLHYYANLCLRNLQELTPGLTDTARLTAGQTAADQWVEAAPIEKAWMSLWRILFLLWQKRLPPGLQPERLEQVLRYAMADAMAGDPLLSRLDILPGEPALGEAEAVKLHHLAGRLGQLGWPVNIDQAIELVDLFLAEVGHRYGLPTALLPWPVDDAQLWFNIQPPAHLSSGTLIAPRAYLAGWALKALFRSNTPELALLETVTEQPAIQPFAKAAAQCHNRCVPDRREREGLQISLRKAWPNRRFDLPNAAPTWLWQALYLAGITSGQLTLILPDNWHKTPGVSNLWAALLERFQLSDLAPYAPDSQVLHLEWRSGQPDQLRVHRHDGPFEVAATSRPCTPGATQIWLQADRQVLDQLHTLKLSVAEPAWTDPLEWGAHLFLRTRLGQYLWGLCSDHAAVPELADLRKALLTHGMPLPDELILNDLSLAGSRIDRECPEQEVLDQELTGIIGVLPPIPHTDPKLPDERAPGGPRKQKISHEQIVRRVFIDGLPRFPEHYLMSVYRPELKRYQLNGPLEITGAFFDRFTLCDKDGQQSLEVSSRPVAEALALASWAGCEEVELPEDLALLEKILNAYRKDLQVLWEALTRECRRADPHRHSALKMARKIWKRQGLPPDTLF